VFIGEIVTSLYVAESVIWEIRALRYSQADAPYTLFTLKETPTPEPISLALLTLGWAVLARRR
jgi:uncharacterized protein (TIGR03382 family)